MLPPHFDMSPHVHDTGHAWMILDGGFEQDGVGDVRWRSPGEIDAYGGGTIHRIHVGDRGCRCVVFEDVAPSPGRALRGAARLSDALLPVLRGASAPASATDAVHELLGRWEPRRGEPPWIHEVDALLAERFLHPLRAGDVAASVGIHRGHLAREYRQFRGRTIADQVRMLRLAWARSVLMEQAPPLGELALAAGFADQSHFTRAFATRYGTSPGRYAVPSEQRG